MEIVHRNKITVGIVGAGPAGLLLAHLLYLEGVDCLVVEARTRDYVEGRIRAGVLEQNTVDLLNQSGVGARLQLEGLVHRGIEIIFELERHRIDLHGLSGGRAITVYGQHEIVKDLIAARLDAGLPIHFGAHNVQVDGIEGDFPEISYECDGVQHQVSCAFIAGCDGSHGICRRSIPKGILKEFEKIYPFAWLGILAEAAPASEELIYANHNRGFGLMSMRSPKITRAYLQCRPDEDLAQWPDQRVWEELQRRLETLDGFRLNEGRIFQKGITPMRSFVVEPMQYRRLFLAGDAAHIVPATGAKGLNLAAADVWVLSRALGSWFRSGSTHMLEMYSEVCLRRVWRVQHFSWWMTSLLHRFDDAGGFDRRRQLAELQQIVSSQSAAATLAENYTGLPLE